MARLSEDEQRAIIAQRMADTIGSTDAELRTDRERALDFYHGRPMGNEIDGRSQVVSKDLMDTIEWIMPSMMRIFLTQDAVQFDPVGPEDEEQAKQETEYIRHVIWKKAKGFMPIYEWIKDALLQKNGYVKYWWEESEKVAYEEYENLTDEQATMTMQGLQERGEVHIVGSEQSEEGWSIRVRVKSKHGCFKFECVPPEEVVVSRRCRGQIKDSPFVGHLRTNVTRSELIEQGYDRARVEKLTSYVWDAALAERLSRDTVNENIGIDTRDDDFASNELQLLECYTYIDVDDDGIAELRCYLLGGNDTLENEEATEIQWESFSPIPVAHRHSGLSMYDLMEDLQRIKTALQRGLLDNVYFQNNTRQIYGRDTDVDSLQINRPGGHVKVNVSGPIDGYIVPMTVQPIADRLLPVIDYIDSVKETRTGVGRGTQGVDADVLAQSTKGAFQMARGDSNQRIEAIARIFAETALGPFYASVHRLLTRHQDWPTKFKLRSKWVQVNPADWDERTDLTTSVGLGNASREEIRANLGSMAQAQERAAQVPGLVQPQNVYALIRRFQSELGFENEPFITDPGSEEYNKFMAQQQGSEDPYISGEKIKSQTRMQEKQVDAQLKTRQLDQDMALGITKLEVESHIDLAKAGIGAEVAIHRGQNQAGPGGERTTGESPAGGSNVFAAGRPDGADATGQPIGP